jgi:antitoxin (DNA-binding transcriptional repressor) of toxin-antitoxin stability system
MFNLEANELRELDEALHRLERGEEVTLTRDGQVIARLVAVGHSTKDDIRQAVAELREARKGQTLGGLSIKELINEGRR